MLPKQFLTALLVTDNGQVSPIPKWDLAPKFLVPDVSIITVLTSPGQLFPNNLMDNEPGSFGQLFLHKVLLYMSYHPPLTIFSGSPI